MRGFVRRLLVVCGVVALGLGAIVVTLWGARRASMRPIEARQRVLLYETDHAALAKALREMWERTRATTRPGTTALLPVDPRSTDLPQAVRSLGAHAIDVHRDGVSVEMGGAWCHFGFEARFAEAGAGGEADVRVSDAFPSQKVAEGLWYYAENGIVGR